MTPDEEKQAIDVYLPLMDEVVARINVVNVTMQNQPKYAPGLVREICYLQYRAICELIAIGCLALYGDRRLPRKLASTYEAPKVINELQKLAPNCYPQPVRFVRDGKYVTIQGQSETDHLSRDKLVTLWGKSGDILHRSPYTKAKRPDPKLLDLSDVNQWGTRIAALLNAHLVPLAPLKVMTVVLKDSETGLPSANFLTLPEQDGGVGLVSHHRLKK